ncbi:MAG: class I SAM-dependent methyltransferase [Anaerolineales bacterium]|nr:class I SAM-dependent methyltransferase [Anaerolineales bacterium]
MSNNSMSLSDVAETGMLTFYCHVVESQNPTPILLDEKAVEISRQLNPVLANSSNSLLRNLAKGKVKEELVVHINLRAKKYDEYANSFLIENPNGVIVNIGCGMDSRFQRIDNGRMTCFDLDLPEMIQFKKQFYTETDRYHFIAASVFDYAWMDQVAKVEKQPVLFVAEGVFMYLDGEKVKDLILKLQSRFPGSELVCEVVTEIFTRKPWNKMVALKMNKQLGVGKEAAFIFGIRNSRELETWHSGIEYLDDWSYFDTQHPRLGWVGMMGKSKFLRNVQYTVHYRLN